MNQEDEIMLKAILRLSSIMKFKKDKKYHLECNFKFTDEATILSDYEIKEGE